MHGSERLPSTSPNGPWAKGSGVTTSERDALYRDFKPLVQSLIAHYGEDPEMRQDLPGEIYGRFCHLVEDYDPSRGIPIKVYLVRALSGSVYSFACRRWRLRSRESTLELE